jgi:hypothetical protein
MQRRFLALISLVGLVLALPACGPRLIPAHFILLAHGEIAFRAARAVIPVPPAAPAVKRLIIVAKVNDIDFTHVRVVFADGPAFERPDRALISPGRDSIVIDVPGDRRKVREVIVQYQNFRQTARRALVEIWGDPR